MSVNLLHVKSAGIVYTPLIKSRQGLLRPIASHSVIIRCAMNDINRNATVLFFFDILAFVFDDYDAR